MVSSERLRSFLVFGEELNFTRAAARLHLSQPALHVQVRKLGEELGVELYRRVGRNIELTAHGRATLAFARELDERSQGFRAELGRPALQRLVVAAGEGTFLYVLGGALREACRVPGLSVRALTRDRDGTVAAVLQGEAHLGVAPLDAVPDGIRATTLRRVGLLAVVPRAHPLARKRSLSLGDLAEQRLILPPAGRPHRENLARALSAHDVPWELSMEASGWELMLHFAALGAGIAVVNDLCRIPKTLSARPLPELPSLRYCLLERGSASLPQHARALRQAIVAAFKR
jgi:LysR family transcriptional regulator, low CO2-responsive transcriptional regulator